MDVLLDDQFLLANSVLSANQLIIFLKLAHLYLRPLSHLRIQEGLKSVKVFLVLPQLLCTFLVTTTFFKVLATDIMPHNAINKKYGLGGCLRYIQNAPNMSKLNIKTAHPLFTHHIHRILLVSCPLSIQIKLAVRLVNS